jgi:membrane-bound lytic murein transglycosylase D
MTKLFLFICSTFILQTANTQVVKEITSIAMDTPKPASALSFSTIKEVKEQSKYNFQPIFTNTKNKIVSSNVLPSFYNQPTNLNYNLNVEAHNFIASYRRKNESELLRMKSWGAYYLTAMENILVQNGIPKQLVYLAVIETNLNINDVSWTGAVGMWQFMPETGRIYGLNVVGGVDERYDWNKSTYAACRYLQDLYKQFGDWLLVVAAYNGGPGRVYSAIKRSGSKNFWDLQYFLPTESSNHVKKFIATQYIMEGSTAIASVSAFPVLQQPKKFFNPLEKGAVALDTSNGLQHYTINGRYNSLIIAKYILLDIASFNILNPNFDQSIGKDESAYVLNLPEEKMNLFKANKLQIMNESLQLFLTINNAMPSSTIPPKYNIKKKRKY